MRRRFDHGHRAFVAELDRMPAAWGWVATRRAVIGELAAAFEVPAGERYLWNLVTRPSHRGLGIYPRLLDVIVRAETAEAERFRVGWAPENHASGAGMRKAGFAAVAELSFDSAGRPAMRALRRGRGAEAERLLGLAPATQPLAPCCRRPRAGRPAMGRAPGACRCDYQMPASGCAACGMAALRWPVAASPVANDAHRATQTKRSATGCLITPPGILAIGVPSKFRSSPPHRWVGARGASRHVMPATRCLERCRRNASRLDPIGRRAASRWRGRAATHQAPPPRADPRGRAPDRHLGDAQCPQNPRATRTETFRPGRRSDTGSRCSR